jgi:hypothetical protein
MSGPDTGYQAFRISARPNLSPGHVARRISRTRACPSPWDKHRCTGPVVSMHLHIGLQPQFQLTSSVARQLAHTVEEKSGAAA